MPHHKSANNPHLLTKSKPTNPGQGKKQKKVYREKSPSNKSIPKTDVSTNSSGTFSFCLYTESIDQNPQFQKPLSQGSNTHDAAAEIRIQEEVRYKNVQEYQNKVEALLRKSGLNEERKVYLRLVLVDRQYENDKRLGEYLERAMEHYRQFKMSQIAQLN